jgi:O-acetylhomoserine/O-acetylserine sulfhydrylase-like pyridoxal-dependent enzyme
MAAIFTATDAFLGVGPDRTGANGRGGVPNFVASANCYGGSFLLFNRFASTRGVQVRWVTRPRDLDDWARQIDRDTRFVYGEMPSNPGLAVLDIQGLADLAHSHGLPLILDATIATPALMRPLRHGADIVIHSLTKSMCASGFAIAGAVISRPNITSRVGTDEMLANFAAFVRRPQVREYGPSLSPFNALMVLNDVRTLRSRMDRLSSNALKVAEFLAEHPKVEAVNYPGLRGSPLYELGARYMWLADGEADYGAPVNRFGQMLSFQVKGGAGPARAAFDRLGMIWRATDLGRIKSVATIPAISTHSEQGEAGRALAAVPENLIRLSVGGEHPADVMDDLDQALRGA